MSSQFIKLYHLLVLLVILTIGESWKGKGWTGMPVVARLPAACLTSTTIALSCMFPFINPAFAANSNGAIASTASGTSKVTYKSGKSPVGLPAVKTDSKKDITFLRCMSNCKTDCQKPGEGLAKLDCIQDCQDQCCNSYEQCSFKINSNGLGNGI